MPQPKVSVIIPVYNVEEYLQQCLDSVVNQTLTDIEILCVDDGSTDSSLEILQAYAEKDPRIKVLQQQNLFAGVARNNGMKAATGKYYMFLDSDDFFEPEMLEALYLHAEETAADICLCGADRYDHATGEYTPMPWLMGGRYFRQGPISKEDHPDNLFQITSTHPWNKFFSAAFIKAHGLEFQALPRANDAYFSMCALFLAQRIAAVDLPFVHYRVGISGSLQANNHLTPLCFCQALEAVCLRLSEEEGFSRHWVSFANNAISQCVYNLNRLKNSPEAFRILADALEDRYLDLFGIARGMEENRLDKSFTQQLTALLEDGGFPALKIPEATDISETVPCVSVIVPVYNVEKYLPECLDSVVNQTLKNIEIICVNDGSPDNSAEILEAYRQKDSRVSVITQENAGLSAARNNGFARATGKYVFFLDSDDIMEPTALELLYGVCKENQLDLLHFDFTQFYDDGTAGRSYERTDLSRVFDGVTLVQRLKTQCQYTSVVWSYLFRREFLSASHLDFFPGILHEDELFTFLSFMEARRASHIEEKLYRHRLRDQSIMTAPKSAKNVYGYFVCMREILLYGLSGTHSRKKSAAINQSVCAMLSAARWLYNQLPPDRRKDLHFDEPFSAMLFEKLVCSTPAPAPAKPAAPAPTAAPIKQETLDALRRQNKLLTQEISDIHSSVSYQLGRLITWLPRKMRGLSACLKEHGLRYTLGRIPIHMGLKADPYRAAATQAPLPVPVPAKPAAAIAPAAPVPAPKPTREQLLLQKVAAWHRRQLGRDADLQSPRTLNEKIQWLKLFDCQPKKSLLADKYLFRTWVAEHYGEKYLIPLLGVWDTFSEIDIDSLPEQFAMKATHGSSWNIIVKNKADFDAAEAEEKFERWLATDFSQAAGQELHYAAICPRIIAEEYHPCQYEYQYWCFNGVPKFISAIHEPHGENSKATYDLAWNKLDFVTSLPRLTEDLPKPPVLEEMSRIATSISKEFAFVRVDFLYDGENLYIGEITFTPASGVCRWDPVEYDKILGDMLTLPPKSPIPQRITKD